MKPLLLKFTAFGPYPDQQVIDFSELQTSKMFVITGPTGSGKTTIFDAMSFALYGSASGSDRSNDMFRSDFAKSTIETNVEFEFIVKNKHFKINRTPSQWRPKLRGEGLRKIDGSVTLTVGDQVYTAITEVNEIIETELGLTKDQFKQIVLLPQGEFKRLLVSNSRDKEEIFRKIFNTAHIKQIQEQLRTESSELKRKIEDSQLKLKTIFSAYSNLSNSNQLITFQTSTNYNVEQLSSEINKLNILKKDYESQIERELQFQKDTQQLEQVKLSLSKFEAQVDKYNTYADFIEHLPLIININNLSNEATSIKTEQTSLKSQTLDLKQQLEIEEQKLQQATNEFNESSLKLDQIPQLEQQVLVTSALIDQVNNELKIIKDINNYSQQVTNLEQQLESEQSNLTKLELKAKSITSNIEVYNQNLLEIEKTTGELEKIKTKITVISQIDKLKTQQKIDLEQSNQLTIDAQQANTTLNQMREQFISAQAGNLALSLEPNVSCPVCGSKQHPHPAQLNINSITNLDIQNQEQIAIEINTKLQSMLNQIETNQALSDQLIDTHQITDSDYQAQYQQLKVNLEQLISSNKRLEINLEQVNLELEQVKTQVASINTEIEKYKFAIVDLNQKLSLEQDELNSIDQYKSDVNCLQTTINKIKTNHEQVKLLKTDLEHKLSTINLEIKLKTASLDQLEQKLVVTEQQIVQFKATISDQNFKQYTAMLPQQAEIRNQYNQYVTDLALLNQQQVELQQLIDNYQSVDLNLLKTKLKQVLNQLEQYLSLSDDFKSLAARIKTDLEAVKKIELATGSLLTKYQLIADISDVANGKTISKISFERYMLAIYFKQIISRANIYFKTMTNNRFELEYKSPSSRKGAQGLDLNIIDNYTSKTRDVKSLSGGESFKAALSMALGLSDIVQMNSGGIQIDTILIDEGFGSLDVDSLNSAIDTLVGIESEGRMVGIISHVEELKNQISNKIEITPSSSGSTLRTNFR